MIRSMLHTHTHTHIHTYTHTHTHTHNAVLDVVLNGYSQVEELMQSIEKEGLFTEF